MRGYKIVLPKKKYFIIASVKKRGLAFLIDLIVFFFFIMTPFLFLYYQFAGVPVDNVTLDLLMNDINLFRIASIGDFVAYSIFFFYLAGSELLMGSTIGKKMLNLSVISKNKKKPALLQLVIRNLSKSLFLSLLIFDSILILFDAEHRRLLDFLANTLVVENRKRIKTFPVVNEV